MLLVFSCLCMFTAKPIIAAIIPGREMSSANTPSPSCKQITLRGLSDVCKKWNQLWRPHCAVVGAPPADTRGVHKQKMGLHQKYACCSIPLWIYGIFVMCCFPFLKLRSRLFASFTGNMLPRSTCSWIWIMPFDGSGFFAISVNQSLKFPPATFKQQLMRIQLPYASLNLM